MPQDSPKISVVIPTHNSSLYIERCLQSVVNQSLKDNEILVVDDQSSDDTLEKLTAYADRHPRFKLLHTKKPIMAGGARNLGLEIATGQYVSFIDSDDWIDTDFLFCLVAAIEEANADIAVCGVKREYPNAKDSTVRYKYNTSKIIDGKFALLLLSRMVDQDVSISAIVCNKLFRSRFIANHQLWFFENRLNEGDIFIFNAFFEADVVAITNKTNYHIFQRRNSVSSNFEKKHVDDWFFAFQEIRKLLTRKKSFQQYKQHYYAFFEKCLTYVIETMRLSEQDDRKINDYLKYAYSLSEEAISMAEFIDYCGSRRLERFFLS